MLSCFGFRKSARADEEQPLLADYQDDTVLQRELHQKLHTYQMLRALANGYLPSTEQAIVNLRTLLGSEFLNPTNDELSDAGQALIHYLKQWLQELIQLLQNKNGQDQIQDFAWYLSKSRIHVDVDDLVERSSKAKAKADTVAGKPPSTHARPDGARS
jgi:hypothetical protein